MARRAGGSVISCRLKRRATPEDSPLIHAVVLRARTSLSGDLEHTHEPWRSDSQDYPLAAECIREGIDRICRDAQRGAPTHTQPGITHARTYTSLS